MKKTLALILICLTAACGTKIVETKQTYPYGMNEQEWNKLSIKDQVKLKRDFYFYEKGNTSLIDPNLEVEGKQEELPLKYRRPAQKIAE